jgi:hypothetical protein
MSAELDLIDSNFLATLATIEARKNAAEVDRQNRERVLQSNLTERNRAAQINYGSAINPYGRSAENGGKMGQGVSDYLMNSAYASLLAGQGQNYNDYQSGLSDSDAAWADYVAQMAGEESNARSNYSQQRTAQVNSENQAAEQKRQFDESLKEQQRQFNESRDNSSGGGGGGGSVDLSGGTNNLSSVDFTNDRGIMRTENPYGIKYDPDYGKRWSPMVIPGSNLNGNKGSKTSGNKSKRDSGLPAMLR